MNTRTRILEAAAALLDESPDSDFSTRAVCEAAGVGAPALYRHFGDKDGLLGAVVDFGFEKYLSTKRNAVPSVNPVADLRSGWDSHVAFALAHPTVYRLMYSPGFSAVPSAARDALQLLREVLERCAGAGLLLVSPDVAAQMIMAANVGVALSLVAQPANYPDQDVSMRVRDAVHAGLLRSSAAPADDLARVETSAVAAQLASLLRLEPASGFTPAERELLHQWLATLSRPQSDRR